VFMKACEPDPRSVVSKAGWRLLKTKNPNFRQDVTKTVIGNPTTIDGIPLPSDALLFLALCNHTCICSRT
jgi:hypothetical protein